MRYVILRVSFPEPLRMATFFPGSCGGWAWLAQGGWRGLKDEVIL